MRLDELAWTNYGGLFNDRRLASFGSGTIWEYPAGGGGKGYTISSNPGGEYWFELDALTAQAVLFELCSRSDP